MSAEPTAEQRRHAMDVLGWAGHLTYENDLAWHQQEDIDNIARALAAAVTAEREKYLRVADELKEHADGAYRERKLYPPESAGRARYEYRGLALALAARRIREVTM